MKNYLLPHGFQIAGWWILLSTLVAAAVGLALDADGTSDTFSPLMNPILAAAHISLLLIACSREKIEDEMVAATRVRSVCTVAYAALTVYVAASVATILLGKADGQNLAHIVITSVTSPALLFWVYEAIFRIRLSNLRKLTRQ